MTVVTMKDHLKPSTNACLQVLHYWHQLEFFSVFNLDDAIDYGQPCLDIAFSSLQSDKANQILPWLAPSNLSHYQLYLMPFDKKELTVLSNRHFPLEYRQYSRIDIEENYDDEGLTCFARLFVDKHGCPDWDGLSISTLPWAMGMLQLGELNQLSLSAYENDMLLLKSSINALKLQFENNHEQTEHYVFDAKLLLSLLKNLCQWARFAPNFPFIVKIQPIVAKQDTTSILEKTIPIHLPATTQATSIVKTDNEPLAILNSFFIQDLEKVCNYVANHDHRLLQLYINGCCDKKDVQHHEQRAFLLHQLQPNHSNIGRWPAPDKQMMSLMQQLCINQYINADATQPIIATNGPPGTGKTTILKEIISENIVQRALKLAAFSSVNDCFSERKKITINGDSSTIAVLKPELTGFEMLVVSSNNTAVENITRELPLRTSIAAMYQTDCHYLRSVAAKLAANHHQKTVIPLPDSLQPWGLIAIALGKSSNCEEFIQKFFFSPDTETSSQRRVEKGNYLTIWEWRDQYQGASFTQAKTHFMAAWQAVDDYQKKLQTLSDMHATISTCAWTPQLKHAYTQLKASLADVNVPSNDTTTTDHIIGYWQSEKWNALRNNLFICALQLHEAWLAEGLQKKLFGGNLFAIKTVLEGNHPLSSTDELIIWQSLFMMIPVVSSTFASIGRLFKNLSAQTLGSLLIDEAGQAIPQAAVGALWRCKKAVIVGDPRQIEPITSVPPYLIEGLAKHQLPKSNTCWLPHATSIQKLADLASPLGSTIQFNQQQEWIGIPLLVHRRCLEPMFSIANHIAYENKMIHARDPTQSINISLPMSTWFDVPGTATDKQFVPEHTICLLELFIACYNHDKGLPNLFIITPFKQIRKHLKTLIENQRHWIAYIDPQLPVPTSHETRRWLHRHIGTVHTFQGKESQHVIFVLGADKHQKGAITWASSKPNLLNVALTRAKDRIYIIGEWDIWANQPFFSQASAVLERKKYQSSIQMAS